MNACQWVAHLPYRRNSDKNDPLCLFKDLAGTCSTKHATLRRLALEQGRNEVELVLGIVRMDVSFDKKVSSVLAQYGLQYIPEAHNYLRIGASYYDFTSPQSDIGRLRNHLLEEHLLEYNQISDYKVRIHKEYIQQWLQSQSIGWELDRIWEIREECIKALQS